MLKFAANISTMFGESAFLERFAAAKRAGFDAVECQFPYDFRADSMRAQLKAHQLRHVLLNAPPGDFETGERGTASLPGRETETRDGIALALEYALTLDCKNIHVMAGLRDASVPYERQAATFVDNIRAAASQAAPHQRNILIEPINSYDIPDYFLNSPNQALPLLEQIDRPNVYLQLDVYHFQLMVGDLEHQIRKCLPYTKHIQIAGVPHRHEPDSGEVNYAYVFSLLVNLGYQGWIGCEYYPKGGTVEGLGWLKQVR